MQSRFGDVPSGDTAASDKQSGALPLPTINHKRCTGCHICVDLCPTNALAQINGKAILRYPDLCTYCTACEDACPENAIALPFLVVFGDSGEPSINS